MDHKLETVVWFLLPIFLVTLFSREAESQTRVPANTASYRKETSRPFLISDTVPPVVNRFGISQKSPATQEPQDSVSKDDTEKKAEEGDDLDSLLDSSIESLATTKVAAPDFNLEVTTVSRQKSTIGRSPAAVYVLTSEQIRRSGARTIPDLLRMVPGLQVAEYSNNTWMITSRGFGDLFAKRLLVQVDGRAVFQPTFNGVYWDSVDVLMDDIDRIEVIRGPGGSMWGANAVNGIINIITKSSADTRGFFAEAGGGNEALGFIGMRVGGQTPAGINWRVSGKWQEFDQAFDALGRQNDRRQQGRVNFRTDWENDFGDSFTFLGGTYSGISGESFPIAILMTTLPHNNQIYGSHALFRWNRQLSEDSSTTLQAYFDYFSRDTIAFDNEVFTFDVDFQHRFKINERNKFIWGMGYRQYWDDLSPNPLPVLGPVLGIAPRFGLFDNYSLFFQNETEVIKDKFYFIAGTKVSDNPFTNFEFQPSIRALWLPDDRSAGWASVSRAVRTPTRLETSIVTGTTAPVFPNPRVHSENALSYELGFRRQPNKFFSYDAAVYFTRFDDIVLTTNTPPLTYDNRGEGTSWGAEVSTKMQMTDDWDLSAWYAYIDMDITEANPGLTGRVDIFAPNQAFLMSHHKLTQHVDFTLMTRYVDNLKNNAADKYLQVDMRLGAQLTANSRFDLSIRNLLDSHTTEILETNGGSGGKLPTEAQQSVYGVFTWRR